MKRYFNFLIWGLSVSFAFFSGNAKEKFHSPVKKWEDVKFISHATGDLLLDVFRSDDKQIRPAILCLHGGFWAKGSKKFMHPLALDLVEKGYIAVCSNYRLTDVAPAPAQRLAWRSPHVGAAVSLARGEARLPDILELEHARVADGQRAVEQHLTPPRARPIAPLPCFFCMSRANKPPP